MHEGYFVGVASWFFRAILRFTLRAIHSTWLIEMKWWTLITKFKNSLYTQLINWFQHFKHTFPTFALFQIYFPLFINISSLLCCLSKRLRWYRAYWSAVIKCQPNISLWLINYMTSAMIQAIKWFNAAVIMIYSNCGFNGALRELKVSSMQWIVCWN